MQTANAHIRGIAPILTHNGCLVDPTNEVVREIKKLTAKKTKKTDADNLEIARLEFIGGLYLNDDGHPCVPMVNLEACIRDGARARRQGKDTEMALFCTSLTGDTTATPLIYDGPRDIEELYKIKKHVHRCSVVIKEARVMRVRPMFPVWEVKFQIHIDDDIMNPSDVNEALHTAGSHKGLADGRPKYGRFEVVSFQLQ